MNKLITFKEIGLFLSASKKNNGLLTMEKQLAFRVFINENNLDQNIRSWLEWFVDSISELSSFDVFEFYSIDSSRPGLNLKYFSGNKLFFNPEGISLPVAKKIFETQNELIFPNELKDLNFEIQNQILDKLPKWKLVIPLIIDKKCYGVISILSEIPFRQNEKFIVKCREWAKQSALIIKNSLLENNNNYSTSSISNSIETVDDMIFELNENFEITFSNNSFKNFLQKFSGKIYTKSNINFKLITGNEFSDIVSAIQKALNGNRNFCDKRILIDGVEKNFHFTFSPVSATEKKCFCFATEILLPEKTNIISSKNNLDYGGSLIQLIPDIVWVVDERGTIKFVNSSFERITGFSSDEVIGRSSFEFFSKEELPNHLQQMLLYLSGKTKKTNDYFEFKFQDKQGKNIVLESVAINQLDHEEIKGIVVSARNVTRQASERRELEDKEELYHSLFESLSEAILITDKNHFLVYCNSLLSELTGYTMAELGSMPLYQLIVAEEYWSQVINGINNRLSGTSDQYEVELVRKDGNRIWALITAAPYKNKSGEIVGSVGTIADITQRKKAEDEIRWLAKFPEENPSPIIRISDSGKVLYFNKPSQSIINHISNEGVLNSEWQNIISKQIQIKNINKIDIDVEGRYYNLTITPLINKSYCNIYAIDITDRIIFQKQLLESEQRLQFLMNSTTEGILVHDNGIIIDLNQAIARLTGYKEEEILGKSILFFSNEINRELFVENSNKDLTLPFESIIYNKDGNEIKVEITGRSHFYKGRKVKVVAIRDITLRKKAEQQLKENEERLKYFFSITSEGILLINNEKIIDVNTAFLKLTGFSQDEVLNKNISELNNETMKEKLSSLLDAENKIETVFDLKTKDGKLVFVEVNSEMQEYLGQLIRVVIIRDITQLKKDEEEILNAKKVAEDAQYAEEQFLAKMSHEIRTPMNGIIGLTDILLKEPATNEQEEYLRLIKQSADNLLVIINDILDLSKIRSGKIQFEVIDINLREIMRAIFMATNTKAVEKKLDYNFTIDTQIPEIIRGDRIRLNQILLNLISNAIKFTEKGRINYSAEFVKKEFGKVYIKFKVEDSGIGIPESEQSKIFEAYRQASADTTRKFGGTGLGLPIVKQLVELQGGEIQIKSIKGEGSTFSFILPFESNEISEASTIEKYSSKKNPQKEIAVEKNGINILLVDDNFINRLLVIHLLEEKGYSVIEAENGFQAIEKLKEEDIDLVLMDISMPDLDGLEATRIIRKMDEAYLRKVPIIAMTAHAFQEQIQEAIDCGMNDYLSKPFKPEELFQKIANLLNPDISLEPAELVEEITDEKYYDLSFLTQYYDNEKEFINSILALYVKETPSSIYQIENALTKKDWASFKSLSHKIKTNIMMMGIKKAESFLHIAATTDINNVNEEKLKSSFDEFRKISLKAIEQIAQECL